MTRTVPMDALDRLPDEEREALILSSFYGLARDEIASILGASAGIVDRLLDRARQHLQLVLTAGVPRSRETRARPSRRFGRD